MQLPMGSPLAMGLLLSPALMDIFVRYHESKQFSSVQKPTIYFQYVDDTFDIFKQEGDVDDFLKSKPSERPTHAEQ